MDWWILELMTTALLVALALWLGPFIKRFGKSYAADVFRSNPRTGKSFILLTDIAYYLIFLSYILFTVSYAPKSGWSETVNAQQLQHETARVAGILLIIGLLHGLNLLALPVMGRLLTLNRRLGRRDARSPAGGGLRSDREAVGVRARRGRPAGAGRRGRGRRAVPAPDHRRTGDRRGDDPTPACLRWSPPRSRRRRRPARLRPPPPARLRAARPARPGPRWCPSRSSRTCSTGSRRAIRRSATSTTAASSSSTSPASRAAPRVSSGSASTPAAISGSAGGPSRSTSTRTATPGCSTSSASRWHRR